MLHAGVPLKDVLVSKNLSTPHALADLYFQLTWNLSLSTILAGIKHLDLHLENILVKILPCARLVRYSLWESADVYFDVEYTSNFDICFIDWANYEPVVHTSGMRSSSNSQRQKQIPSYHDLLSWLHQGIRYYLPEALKKEAMTLVAYACEEERFSWMQLRYWADYIEDFRTTTAARVPRSMEKLPLSPSDRADIEANTFCRKYLFYPRHLRKSGPGRPRVHASDADRLKAHRFRKAHPELATCPLDKFGITRYDSDLIIVADSLTAGLGVFAARPISKGSYITGYEGADFSALVLTFP